MRKFAILTTAVVAQCAFVAPTSAHFPEPVPLGWYEWAERQKNENGNRCCDNEDARFFKGRWEYHTRASDGWPDGVTLYFDTGETARVAQNRMLKVDPEDPNPTGQAVVWFDDLSNIYCFGGPGPLA